jgi:L-aspartate oxidase
MEQVGFLIIGGGIAGLSAAVRLAAVDTVLVVTKEELAESNTAYAQGGIAVAMGGAEDIAEHLEDTVSAGDGLVNREAAAVLVEQGPKRVEELLAWGTDFDRAPATSGGELLRTREGAHSRARILHADGDATGREIALSLLRHARETKGIALMEFTTSVDLITEEIDGIKTVVGATLLDRDGKLRHLYARAVLIASGGAGQVYSDTTNPPVATGDGIAMAYRAGAALSDMEFYQFHPTAFALQGAPRFLLSEALRGEGAWLVDAKGECFMHRYHPLLELAPRDVVARAITRESLKGPVYLDMRHVSIDLKARFPGISKFLAGYNLELGRDLIPVRPAAHYLMGGIAVDVHGQTTLPGLFAAGEAACTGVHGANRLASNSLLEGLVFGALAAEAMRHSPELQALGTAADAKPEPTVLLNAAAVEDWIAEVRAIMWEDAGLLRDAEGLKRAQSRLDALVRGIPRGYSRRAVEARSLYTIASVLVASATAREESRGAHFRSDFPQRDPIARHSIMERGKLSFAETPETEESSLQAVQQ